MAETQRPANEIAEAMAAIYASLIDRQQPLGPEAEAAIFEGLDDLYEA